ncbi:SDR family NAD(P)-dependent oxidoreductase [Bradyrhizobium prioriisuperbiae]|uniref:SDR family NAD(P)-dependent oxidoreductase n=1 Tax=Bradyrhizobium prioriisuperbiae TaxID=2854389 RepID=UPI0028E93BC7|nr:SDR family oxidoreductase [Bradyrhizobium prioritasuperba]
MDALLDLKGRVALVTGAGQGVGRQVALHMAAHNAGGIVVNDFHAERAKAVAEEIAHLHGNALPVACDVTDFGAVTAMFRKAESKFGRIDILVNNAGNAGPTQGLADIKPFWETGPDDWASWLGTNLYGVLNCTRAAIPGMLSRNEGRVITVISDAGRVGEPHLAVYSGAKAGAAGFMRGLAKAVGRNNITANCVALAGVNTPGVAGLVPDEDTMKKILRSYLIRRLGEPNDAANMILFLASDAASWVTGQTYPVNGGYSVSV